MSPSHPSKQAPLNMLRAALVLVTCGLIGACASGPKLYVNQDPNVDFSRFETYGFEDNLGTDERQGYTSILSKYFINAVSREMDMRGYTQSDNPDITINFYVHSKEKIRTTSSPSMGGYYGYRGYGAYGGYDTTVTQYTEGTVSIDLVDATSGNKTLAWEGTAVGKVTDEVRENLEEAVSAVVAEIYNKYPYTGPNFVPPANN